MLPLLTAMRPRQWTKNGFVLAPLVFGRVVMDPGALTRTVLTAFAFCLVSSAVYLSNDVADRDSDRAHPTKRHRAVASGKLSPAAALGSAAALLGLGLGMALLAAPAALLPLGVYALLTTAYSFALKRVALLDVLVISAGFVLRVLSGAMAAHVRASHWLLLCTFFVALFLALSKRRGELASLGSGGRAALEGLSLPLVESFETVALGVTILCYALYTVSPETIAFFGSDRLMYTLPFVVFGLFRWRVLESRRIFDDPSSDLFTDAGLLLTVLLWAVTAGALIYLVR
jgi:4-hydroxybenzoate polyprenyltransferase